MAREINRKRLTRMLKLPDGAEDAEIIEQIREQTELANSCVRPFVLPTGLDLRGCLYALWDCVQADDEFGGRASVQLSKEIVKLKAAHAERLRTIDYRFLLFRILIDEARDQTEWEPLSVREARHEEKMRAKKEAASERRREKKAAAAAKDAEGS